MEIVIVELGLYDHITTGTETRGNITRSTLLCCVVYVTLA